MFKIITKEDTFTPWINRKEKSLYSLRMELINVLGKIFIKTTNEFTPHLSGALEKSAYHFWEIVDYGIATGVLITWTGLYDVGSRKEEFNDFGNEYLEDYALSNYMGYYYSSMKHQSKSAWVLHGINAMEYDEIEEALEEGLLKWLFK